MVGQQELKMLKSWDVIGDWKMFREYCRKYIKIYREQQKYYETVKDSIINEESKRLFSTILLRRIKFWSYLHNKDLIKAQKWNEKLQDAQCEYLEELSTGKTKIIKQIEGEDVSDETHTGESGYLMVADDMKMEHELRLQNLRLLAHSI
jgi:hypothetical protein